MRLHTYLLPDCSNCHSLHALLTSLLQVHGDIPQEMVDAAMQEVSSQLRSIVEAEGLAPNAFLPARAHSIARIQAHTQAQGQSGLTHGPLLPQWPPHHPLAMLPSVSEVEPMRTHKLAGASIGPVLNTQMTHGSALAAGVVVPVSGGGGMDAASANMQRLLGELSHRRSLEGENLPIILCVLLRCYHTDPELRPYAR